MSDEDLCLLSATEAAERLREGSLGSEQLVGACLDRIEQTDGDVQAWAHLDREHALEQARFLDQRRQAGAPCGPLHGVPVGIKDIIDVYGMPCENGTVLDAGRRAHEDASAVRKLREAGAVIMGKTVTTELAVYSPGKTRNPHNPQHTPGGSSSGSAAAVAANMVPLAVGTQTNGSVIRPASFCGTVGYKPTYGLIPRTGVLTQSPFLDNLGVFARSVGDAALLAEAMMGSDPHDLATSPSARPALSKAAASEPPLTPVFAFVKSPVWDQADDTTQEAFNELADFLDDGCDEFPLPNIFDKATDWHRTVMYADIAKNFASYFERGGDRLSATLRGMIEEGQKTLAVDYARAQEWREVLNSGLDEIFDRFDAVITPATLGEAPAGLDATGNPAFCTLWTFCGMPAITLPLMTGPNGLPLGVQLVGPRGDDERLLRAAQWLMNKVEKA
ncbi:MAG: amidase [Rhodospirillales bacterium]|nr:amidase [Rhodospirillales bacterium]MCW8971028.1 amidase [Rhodospirillales bacterium]